jgi:hypothetical protein
MLEMRNFHRRNLHKFYRFLDVEKKQLQANYDLNDYCDDQKRREKSRYSISSKKKKLQQKEKMIQRKPRNWFS